MVWTYFYVILVFVSGRFCMWYIYYLYKKVLNNWTVYYFWERFREIFRLKERRLLPLSRFYFTLFSMKVLQENELATYCYWNIIYCLHKSCIVSILSVSNPKALFVSKYLTYHWPRSIRLSLDFSLLDEREEQTISS